MNVSTGFGRGGMSEKNRNKKSDDLQTRHFLGDRDLPEQRMEAPAGDLLQQVPDRDQERPD